MAPWRAACAALAAALLAGLAAQLAPLVKRVLRLQRVLVAPHEKAADALRIGLLGASFIGRAAVIHAADKRKDVVVVAVAARDAERAAAFAKRFGIASSYGGKDAYAELLRHPGLDAVYVGLPTRLHYRWAEAALAAGKHVLVEKPVAASGADAEALAARAARAGLVLFEGAHYRYHPAPLRARELMAFDRLGRLTSLEARFSMLDPKAWFFNLVQMPPKNASEERLHERVKNLDRWWYCLDSLLWASGATSAKVVSALESRYSLTAQLALTIPASHSKAASRQKPYVVNATIEMARDRLTQVFDWSLKAIGEHGTVHLANLGFPFLWHSITWSSASGSQHEQLYGDGETTFEHQLGAFVATVRGGGRGLSTAAAGAPLTMDLVDEIYKASGSGPIPSQMPSL